METQTKSSEINKKYYLIIWYRVNFVRLLLLSFFYVIIHSLYLINWNQYLYIAICYCNVISCDKIYCLDKIVLRWTILWSIMCDKLLCGC